MPPFVQKRIKEYNTPGARLNKDQKRSVATLPGLEAVVKELEEVKKSIEVGRPIHYPPIPEERATWGGPDPPGPVETPAPTLPPEGYRGTDLNTGKDARQTSENFLERSISIQDDVGTVTASTPLSMLCRVCNASPTVGTRPTITTCGHLFCSEYVLKISSSATAELTLRQVYYPACNVDLQMPCVQWCPLVVLLIQTRSPSIILGLQLL